MLLKFLLQIITKVLENKDSKTDQSRENHTKKIVKCIHKPIQKAQTSVEQNSKESQKQIYQKQLIFLRRIPTLSSLRIHMLLA
jgi:hypothetical protein